MATVRDTIRHLMLSYPSGVREPLDALDTFFAKNGTGYDWNSKGELVSVCNDNPKAKAPKMCYDTVEAKTEATERTDPGSPLAIGWTLEAEAEKLRLDFIAANIERMLRAPLTNVYFERSDYPQKYGVTRDICIRYSNAFNFPDNINKDWADALAEYFDHWHVRLNTCHGVSGQPGKHDDVSWWPQDAQEARQAIYAAQKRLWPIRNNGETWEAGRERIAGYMKGIFDKLDL